MKTQGAGLFCAVLLAALPSLSGELIRLNQRSFSPLEVPGLHVSKTPEAILQFKDAINEDRLARLRGMGLEVLGYLPEDALVIRGPQPERSLSLPGARALVPYLPEDKLSRDFDAASVFDQNRVEKILIHGFRGTTAREIENLIEAQEFEAVILHAEARSVVVEAPVRERLALAALPGVEHLQPLPLMVPMLIDLEIEDPTQVNVPGDYSDLVGDESGTKALRFEGAWAKGLTGKGQIVSMADTGLDQGNPNLLSADFKASFVAGHHFGLYAKSWEDPLGHGTHVAGSMMGRGQISGGKIKGGAFEAGLVGQSMWSPMLNNLSVPSRLGDMFARATQAGARVHSNSWGAARNFGAYDSFAQQVDEWVFQNPDTLVLFAAGNSGVDANKDGRIDSGSVSSPGTSKNALTVGASENATKTGGIQVPISRLRTAKDVWPAEPIWSSYISDNINGLAMFSSRGPTNDRRIKPDIVAAGTNILSNRSHHKDAQDMWGKYNDEYMWAGGTSMATPLTAGAAALTRQMLMERLGQTNPSSALLKAALLHTAADMYPGQFGEIGAARGQEILTRRPNSDQGYGRVDVTAISSLTPASLIVDDRQGVATGETKEWALQVPARGSLLVNLVYNDAPASPNAATALVNDLDVTLVRPDGSQVSPQDRVNNHEIIELSGLPEGTYRLIVRGHQVPQGQAGKQPFALLATAK